MLRRCAGINPPRFFIERSKDSICCNFPNDDGIEPVRALCDKFRVHSDFNHPISSGIALANCCESIMRFRVQSDFNRPISSGIALPNCCLTSQ